MSGSLAVCSWSLRPTSPGDLIDKVRATGVAGVQLALDPIRTGAWDEAETVEGLNDAGIRVVSGMMMTAGEDYSTLDSIRATGGVRPDGTWDENLQGARDNAEIAERLGVSLVTLHAGFIPHDSGDPEWGTLIGRLRDLVDAFGAHGVRVGLETGQETADSLVAAFDAIDRPTLGVNFDPANMILYGMGDPVRALETLADRVVQVHIKDALRSAVAGQWGVETPAGEGEVGWDAFFAVVGERLRERDLVIEREGGDERIADVVTARDLTRRLAPWIGDA